MIINRPFLHSLTFSSAFIQRLIVNIGNCLPPKIFNSLKTALDKKNAEKCDCICGNMQHMCKNMQIFGHAAYNFCICDFGNVFICRKICDMRILAKYAIAYAIAYSHITSIPICTELKLTGCCNESVLNFCCTIFGGGVLF